MGQPRRFDHEEAAELHAHGWTWARLADRYGVSTNSVANAVRAVDDPEWAERHRKRRTEWQRRNKRRPCKGGCGRLVWVHGMNKARPRTGYCAGCLAERLYGKDMRPGELRCTVCRRWKPDDEFHRRAGGNEGGLRRGRKTQCRACESAARHERRLRRRVPCANCGKPRSHPDDLRRPGSTHTGLCIDCLGPVAVVNLARRARRRPRRRLRARPLVVRRRA